MERQQLIQKIADLPAQLEMLVGDLSEAELTTQYVAGEWSVAQNVHHLADSHLNSYIRCKLMASEDRPPLKPYDQNVWAEMVDASSADVSASLALLKGLHGRWVIFWQNLPEEAWLRPGVHPEVGVVTLESQLKLYAGHGEGHLEQIKRTLAEKIKES